MRYVNTMLPLLFVAVLLGCATTQQPCLTEAEAERFSVTITKGMCFGLCPVYSATVRGNGRVLYDGRQNVDRMGAWNGSVPQDSLCALVQDIRVRKLMLLDTSFVENVPDAPLTTLTISDMGRTRTFRWNMGTPEPLKGIVSRMIALTHENTNLSQP